MDPKTPWLCWLGLHKWRSFNGRIYSIKGVPGGTVVYDRKCERCSKQQLGKHFRV